MLKYLLLAYLAVLSGVWCSETKDNEVSDDQELVLAFVLNRHGERSPDADEMSLSDQQDLIQSMTALEGPEGLTNKGKRRAFQIGKFLRQRYGAEGQQLISNLYRGEEISIRSTNKERTKMTIQVAMAAVYPPEPEQQWDDGLGKFWQPVPYNAVPLSEDYLRYYSNCDRYITLMSEAKVLSLEHELAPYKDLIPLIYENTGRNFTENPLMFGTLYDLFRSLVGLGLDIPEWAKPVKHRLDDAAKVSYRLYFRNDEMKKIGGGVILNDFIKAADDIISGKPVSKRLRLFSCHDFNIGSLMEVANIKVDQNIPEYGSVFALELYKSKTNGDYNIKPIYLRQAGEAAARVLRVKSCDSASQCDYNKFKQITEDFLLPENEYYPLCNIKTEL